jgi:hypothetical protein
VGLLVAALALGERGTALGKVVVEMPVQDFGIVEQGTPVTRSFLLRNKSRQSVRIDRVVPSCACTIAAPEGAILRPVEQSRAWLWQPLETSTGSLRGRTRQPSSTMATSRIVSKPRRGSPWPW